VNYGLSIGGTVLSIFLREDKGIVKISLRSKGQFDVNDLARKHFNGGGHVNAAGGSLTMTMDDALAYTRDLILQLKNVHP
jgi:phosphoesterase RecJ-like protein